MELERGGLEHFRGQATTGAGGKRHCNREDTNRRRVQRPACDGDGVYTGNKRSSSHSQKAFPEIKALVDETASKAEKRGEKTCSDLIPLSLL